MDRGLAARLAIAQGAYYAATGVWALVHMRSFEAVTGPKVDRWLGTAVGVLVTAIGGVLAAAGARRRVTPEIALLATASASGLAAIDTVYALRGRIAPIYLVDALGEVGLLGAWLAARRA